MFISPHILILHPARPDDTIAQKSLISLLKQLAYIGETEKASRFQVGDRFLSHLCFLGCSPDIELSPQADDKPYCYIEIPPSTKQPEFLSGTNIKPPRCPSCKQTLAMLPAALQQQPVRYFTCPYCQTDINTYLLPWRKSACFARSLIRVYNIYESEAIPESHFLESLKQATGFEWKHCYIRQAVKS